MTNWRDYGDVSLAIWRQTLRDAGSDLFAVADDCYAAAKGHTALCLAMLGRESRYWTRFQRITKAHNNPLNLRPPDGLGYMTYPWPEAGILAWRQRITSARYKNGIYANTTTLAELIHVYAPSTDDNDEAGYVRFILDCFAQWGISPQEELMAEITYGLVKHPDYRDRPIAKPEGRGQNDLGKRSVKGVVWHRILGTLYGTDVYFRQAGVKALTDYGVGVLAMDGAAHDGEILRWNNPLGFQSGWASGPVSAPYGDGLSFLQDNGWDLNVVNRDQASIEISGHQTTPLSPKARYAIAAITAYWADQARIPWDQFPIIPGKGYSFVRWHREYTIGSGKECPFVVVMDETASLIELTRAIMRQYQAAATAPDPEPPAPIYAPLSAPAFITPRWLAGGEDAKLGKTKVWALRRRWTARVETPRLQHTGASAPAVGPPVKAGESFVGIGIYRSHHDWWILTEWGTRVAMADMTDAFAPGYPEEEAA